jgi:hypothetical protein
LSIVKPLIGVTMSITLRVPGNYIVQVNGFNQMVSIK